MNNPCTAQALTNIRIRQQNAWKSMQNTNYILNITDPSKYNLILIQEPWFDHVGKTWAMHNWHIVYRVCHEYRKTQGSESQCLRVQVWYLIWHTCAYPWTHAMVSQVHHRYIMGSDLSVSTALFTLMAHGPQGDFLSPRIFSPFFIKRLSTNFLHGTLIYWWLDIYWWNY